jgi:hypothetical protein
MKIFLKAPGQTPQQIVTLNDLHHLQELVGGYIETVTLFEDLCIICDEEGRLKEKPFNCEIFGIDFVGTILIVGVDGEEFTDVPAAARQALSGLWEGDGEEA